MYEEGKILPVRDHVRGFGNIETVAQLKLINLSTGLNHIPTSEWHYFGFSRSLIVNGNVNLNPIIIVVAR